MYHHAILIDKHNQYMNKKYIYIYIDIQIYTHMSVVLQVVPKATVESLKS